MNKYIIFLRGINVGGNKKVPMKQLSDCLFKAGFVNVKTHNNTGNVYLESVVQILDQVRNETEVLFKKEFGFEILVVVRKFEDVEKIITENVFDGTYFGKYKVPYVSFLYKPSMCKFKEEQVVKQTETEICWVHEKGGHDSPFEKSFEAKIGGIVTTRTWNTVSKCVEMGKNN